MALAIHPSFSFFVTLYVCVKAGWFKLSYLFGHLDKNTVVKLARFIAMALTSAVCVPVSHILVRNHLGNTLGWEAAGYWEAMWRLSAAYLMFVTTGLSLYYLPRLSELIDPSEIRNEILQGYRIILPVAAACGLSIYLLRDLIIGLLFTREFEPMRDLFLWQLLGDTLKIGSWILAYLMLGQALIKMFILTEIVFAFGFYFLTYLLTPSFGLQGPVVAHATNYGLYWAVMYFMIDGFLRKKALHKSV